MGDTGKSMLQMNSEGSPMEKFLLLRESCIFFFFFFFLLFRAIRAAYGSSQARGQIGATGLLAYATAIATRDPSHICHHSSRQHRILNPLSWAKDRTLMFMDSSRFVNHWATKGTPLFVLSMSSPDWMRPTCIEDICCILLIQMLSLSKQLHRNIRNTVT